MLIRGVEVVDLLSFQSLVVQFDQGLNVLVGQNDVGKSNLFRLVRLIRELTVRSASGQPPDYGFEQRYVRLDGPAVGRAALRVSFNQPAERAALLLFVRAIAAQAAAGPGVRPPHTPAMLSLFYARTAELVETSLGEHDVSSLFDGRIVLALDARQPVRWALAYEFEHEQQAFHVGLHGSGVQTGVLARGSLDLENPSWATTSLSLAAELNPNNPNRQPISFASLLPEAGRAYSWDFTAGQNNVPRPLTLQLARLLSVAADNSRPPSFDRLLASIVGRSVVSTDNLRRPPRRSYELGEVTAGLSVEDAGDLPLALYRMKNGSPDDRRRYADLQTRFQAMTGRRFDLAATFMPRSNDQPLLDIELQIHGSAGWVPIQNSASGLWETLIALNAAAPTPGEVVLLDEPATHLHSSWQRQLLRYLREHNQVIMVTHSPFLVPAATPPDFQRVTRLTVTDGVVVPVRIDTESAPELWRERWRQIFAGSTDARDVLFSRGVVLVEGDTEAGAFRHWFNDPAVVDTVERGAEARNIAIISVDGDGSFGPWVSYLEQLRIPWLILADGPVLSPKYRRSLLQQLGTDPNTGRMACVLTGEVPDSEEFEPWRDYWRNNRVLTVATTFGPKANVPKEATSPEESGEIESWFARLDAELWSEVKRTATSKVRRGYRFAEELDVARREDALRALQGLWAAVVAQVDSDAASFDESSQRQPER